MQKQDTLQNIYNALRSGELPWDPHSALLIQSVLSYYAVSMPIRKALRAQRLLLTLTIANVYGSGVSDALEGVADKLMAVASEAFLKGQQAGYEERQGDLASTRSLQ